MPKFKLVISNPEDGESQSLELEGTEAQPLLGRKIGEVVDGSIARLPDLKLQITGGSDSDGTPMRPNVHGGVKVPILLSGGTGYHPNRSGERRRKKVRGSIITDAIFQVNMKVVGQSKDIIEKKSKTKSKKSERK